jgi:hypothetical protein
VQTQLSASRANAKSLKPKLIHRGWAIYEDDFGPEDDEGEGQK